MNKKWTAEQHELLDEHLKKLHRARVGQKDSSETIEKRRLACIGKKRSVASRRRMSRSALGRKMSPETKKKVIAALIGRPVSLETRKKMSLAQSGNKHGQWKGGIVINSEGYRLIRIFNYRGTGKARYVHEHRLEMEKHLGRELLSTEIVHHVNENKLDNQIENLHLFPSMKEHVAHHERLKRESNSAARDVCSAKSVPVNSD